MMYDMSSWKTELNVLSTDLKKSSKWFTEIDDVNDSVFYLAYQLMPAGGLFKVITFGFYGMNRHSNNLL